MENLRRISDREEVATSRTTYDRSVAELNRRIAAGVAATPGRGTLHLPGDRMSPTSASETEQRRLQRSPTRPPRDPRLERGVNSLNTQGQPRK